MLHLFDAFMSEGFCGKTQWRKRNLWLPDAYDVEEKVKLMILSFR